MLEERNSKAPIGFGQLPHSRVGGPRDLLRGLSWCFFLGEVRVAIYTNRLQGQIFGLQAADVDVCMSYGDGEDPENSYTHHPLHSHLGRSEDVERCLGE